MGVASLFVRKTVDCFELAPIFNHSIKNKKKIDEEKKRRKTFCC
jgi:hypothetical protein